MKLDIFEYIYNQGQSNEWQVKECQFSQINLIAVFTLVRYKNSSQSLAV